MHICTLVFLIKECSLLDKYRIHAINRLNYSLEATHQRSLESKVALDVKENKTNSNNGSISGLYQANV